MKAFMLFLYMVVLAIQAGLSSFVAKMGGVLFATDNLAIANATTASIRSLHDFHFKKSVMQKLYRTYGEGFNLVDILRSLGREEMVSNESMTHEEEAYDHRTITIGSSNVTPGATPGATASFELDADDLDSQGNYFPREDFTVMFGDTINGFIQARITDITVTAGPTVTLTVKPYDVTKTLSATYVFAGAEIGIFDSAYAVETGQPPATSVGYFERTHYAQILKETIKFGGMELAKQKWVEVEGVGFFNKELARAEFALDRQQEAALLMGQVNTNSIVQASQIDSQNNTVYKNKGVWTWIDELGGEINYAGATGVPISDYTEAAEYFESVGLTDNVVMVLGGGGYLRSVEDSGIEFFSNPGGATTQGGGLTTDFIMKEYAVGGNPSMTLDIGFRAIKKGGILFLLHKLPAFTNPYTFGISGYKLNDAAMMFPLTKVKDNRSKTYIPNLSACHVGIAGYSRKRVVGTIGGMDGFAKQRFGLPIINTVDGNSTYWLSHVMYPFVEAYKGILHKRES